MRRSPRDTAEGYEKHKTIKNFKLSERHMRSEKERPGPAPAAAPPPPGRPRLRPRPRPGPAPASATALPRPGPGSAPAPAPAAGPLRPRPRRLAAPAAPALSEPRRDTGDDDDDDGVWSSALSSVRSSPLVALVRARVRAHAIPQRTRRPSRFRREPPARDRRLTGQRAVTNSPAAIHLSGRSEHTVRNMSFTILRSAGAGNAMYINEPRHI